MAELSLCQIALGWLLLGVIGSGNGIMLSAITWANVDPVLYYHMV